MYQDGNNRLGKLLCREEEKEHGWKLRRSRDEKTCTDREGLVAHWMTHVQWEC